MQLDSTRGAESGGLTQLRREGQEVEGLESTAREGGWARWSSRALSWRGLQRGLPVHSTKVFWAGSHTALCAGCWSTGMSPPTPVLGNPSAGEGWARQSPPHTAANGQGARTETAGRQARHGAGAAVVPFIVVEQLGGW